MKSQQLLMILVSSGILFLTACTPPSNAYRDPQVYGMPSSQFQHLSPAEQQQAMQFHSQYNQTQALNGQQVAQISPNNTQQVIITTQGKSGSQNTTISSSSPSIGNPDLSARNNPDLVGAVVQHQRTAPIVVNTQS
jgi:hypothetical protein